MQATSNTNYNFWLFGFCTIRETIEKDMLSIYRTIEKINYQKAVDLWNEWKEALRAALKRECGNATRGMDEVERVVIMVDEMNGALQHLHTKALCMMEDMA